MTSEVQVFTSKWTPKSNRVLHNLQFIPFPLHHSWATLPDFSTCVSSIRAFPFLHLVFFHSSFYLFVWFTLVPLHSFENTKTNSLHSHCIYQLHIIVFPSLIPLFSAITYTSPILAIKCVLALIANTCFKSTMTNIWMKKKVKIDNFYQV